MKHIGPGTGCRLVAVFQQVLPDYSSGKRASFPDPIDPGQRHTPASERPSRFIVRRIASAHRFLPLEKPRARRAPPDFPGPPRPPMPRMLRCPPRWPSARSVRLLAVPRFPLFFGVWDCGDTKEGRRAGTAGSRTGKEREGGWEPTKGDRTTLASPDLSRLSSRRGDGDQWLLTTACTAGCGPVRHICRASFGPTTRRGPGRIPTGARRRTPGTVTRWI